MPSELPFCRARFPKEAQSPQKPNSWSVTASPVIAHEVLWPYSVSKGLFLPNTVEAPSFDLSGPFAD